MNISTGDFDNPQLHHKGWFRVFRGKNTLEIWFGKKYITVAFKE